MWGTDATRTWTRQDGNVRVFVAIDHCAGDCVGIHAAKKGTRFAALEPVRQGIETHFGVPDQAVAEGLQLRHDCGSQYLSEVFQDEVDFWGIESSPTFVYSPESNGIAERFIRTLKEQLLCHDKKAANMIVLGKCVSPVPSTPIRDYPST